MRHLFLGCCHGNILACHRANRCLFFNLIYLNELISDMIHRAKEGLDRSHQRTVLACHQLSTQLRGHPGSKRFTHRCAALSLHNSTGKNTDLHHLLPSVYDHPPSSLTSEREHRLCGLSQPRVLLS